MSSLPPPPPSSPAPVSLPPPPPAAPAPVAQQPVPFGSTQQFAGLSTPLPAAKPQTLKSWTDLPLFQGLSSEAMRHFRDAMEAVTYPDKAEILRQGEPGDEMFVLERGMVRITVRGDGGKVVFERTIAAPALFGEMALITKEPRTATVSAEEPAHCLRIKKAIVHELFTAYPATAAFLTRLVGERLMEHKGIRKVGKYEVSGRLGSGGVATVFEARHPTLGTPVALKMLSHTLVFDPAFADCFEVEAKLVAGLTHDNIVRVLDTEEAYGTKFIVMEKLTGDMLETLIESGQQIDWPNCRRILREISDALAYSHSHGLIHRDIKPANVFLLTDGKVKLLDFGIASELGGAEGGGKVMGTPYYMSPEQIAGKKLDGRADLYSLGILAYELVTGYVPFDGDTVEELFEHHKQSPLPNPREDRPDLPDDLLEFIERATGKDPDDRFASCADAAAFLKAAAEVPMLEKFAMSALSVTYHGSRKELVERVLAEAQKKLEGLSGVALFLAHRDAGE